MKLDFFKLPSDERRLYIEQAAIQRNLSPVIIEKDEEGWLVSEVVELPGCHTQAKTLDQLMERTKEVIQLYLKCKDPVDTEVKFIGLQKVEVEA